MKKFNKTILSIIIVPLILLGVIACDKDDDNLSVPNHRVIYTSQMDFDNKIQVDNFITFGDVSPGIKSRTWSFPSGVANLETSTESIVKATFTQVGEHNVTLHQVFNGNAYVGETLMGTELDTTIVVKVLAPISISLQGFLLNPDGTLGDELNMSDNAENEVIASREVRFMYTVDGEPENFEWTFQGGDPEVFEGSDPEVDVKYRSVGTYDLSFTAGRARPQGNATVQYTNLIKVVPSTDPVDLDRVSDKDGKIALEFSRDMDPFTLNKDHFSVTIENGGTMLTPDISLAEVDTQSGNVVLLTLASETIYNDDIVKVSYTPGTLTTLDAVAATAFTDAQLQFNLDNILTGSDYDYSFENSINDNWDTLPWGAPWNLYTSNISSVQAKDGNNSMYIEIEPFGGMIMGHRDLSNEFIRFPVETGKTYEIGVWVYVEDLGNNDPSIGFDPDLRFFWNPGTNWGVPGSPTFHSGFTTNEWVYSSFFATFPANADTSFMIRGYNQGNPEALKFYMDNIIVAEVNLRP